MRLFNIPDIRLFWSQDERFLSQFRSNEIIQFKPFSKYPPVCRDVSFWISDQYTPNDFYEVVRDVAGDIAEKVTENQNQTFNRFFRGPRHPKIRRKLFGIKSKIQINCLLCGSCWNFIDPRSYSKLCSRIQSCWFYIQNVELRLWFLDWCVKSVNVMLRRLHPSI